MSRSVERFLTIVYRDPGEPAGAAGACFDRAFCIACGGTTYPSMHALAPAWNAGAIGDASRMGAVIQGPIRESLLAPWYALTPQAGTLREFVQEDRSGGFWTPLGVVCRFCSGMPGVGDDWRASRWVARCFCGWSRAVAYQRSFEKQREVERARHKPIDLDNLVANWVDPGCDEWGAAETRAERSLVGHLGAKHKAMTKPTPAGQLSE